MNPMQAQVQEFHEQMHAPFPQDPYPYLLRYRLIHEELDEFLRAAMNNDVPEVVDAICDLLYVTFGAAVVLGVDIEGAFNLVHKANLLKVGESMDASGKIQKPPGWEPPDIRGWLYKTHGVRAL